MPEFSCTNNLKSFVPNVNGEFILTSGATRVDVRSRNNLTFLYYQKDQKIQKRRTSDIIDAGSRGQNEHMDIDKRGVIYPDVTSCCNISNCLECEMRDISLCSLHVHMCMTNETNSDYNLLFESYHR